MYIDPGYGALILQGVLAGIVGTVFIARHKIALLLGKLLGRKGAPKEQ